MDARSAAGARAADTVRPTPAAGFRRLTRRRMMLCGRHFGTGLPKLE
ncbi:hypothetical protein [Nocardia mexicana]|nr:hypothetical protein [Nocardia mexicana]